MVHCAQILPVNERLHKGMLNPPISNLDSLLKRKPKLLNTALNWDLKNKNFIVSPW